MRSPQRNLFKAGRKIRSGELRLAEPWEFFFQKAVLLDADSNRRLQPRLMPGAKDERLLVSAKESGVTLHRKLAQRAWVGNSKLSLGFCFREVTEAALAILHHTLKLSIFGSMIVTQRAEAAGETKTAHGQRQAKWLRQPPPQKQRARLLAPAHIGANIEKTLLGHWPEQPRHQRRAPEGPKPPHRQSHERYAGLALVQFQLEGLRDVRFQNLRSERVVNENYILPICQKKGIILDG